MIQRVFVVALSAAMLVVGASSTAGAAFTPNHTEYHPLTFPVVEPVHYFDDFGGVRHHPGNDLMGAKLDHELAANDGTITFARNDSSGHSGNMLILTGTDGWKYWYIHINNDTPGTDDGKNPARWRFAPGIAQGSHVKRGQFIAYMGDSGEAETTDPHLHFELHRPDDTFIDPYTSLRLAQGAGANGMCGYPTNPTPHPTAAAGVGFWTLAANGNVLGFGQVPKFGNAPPAATGNPYVALASTPTGKGYWTVDARGHVRAFGDAHGYGGMDKFALNQPMVGIAPTATGKGYWLLARDGGIFSFGDAHFYGSTGAKKLNAPVISMASTPVGGGYWLLAADGGVFSFGDAHFWGSTGAMQLAAPVTSMIATRSGGGYLLLARDGGLFSFGDSHFLGSLPGAGWCPGPAAIAFAQTPHAGGYWMLLSDGQVVAFGNAKPWGEPATTNAKAVALAAAQ
ncbi:MAG TPA: M23 family metallopeptidase [Acidimicrobiia bacterium]|nr:M23 family metallopeptidase [Acidimicrobiia bacterium]